MKRFLRHAWFAAFVPLVVVISWDSAAAEAGTVPAKVIDEPVWTFPLAAERDGHFSGEVTAMVALDEEGHLTDWLVLRYTHPAFRDAVAAALPRHRFAPGRSRGEPAPVRMQMSFSFQKSGALVSRTMMDYLDDRMQAMEGRAEFRRVCPAAELDRPLSTTKVVTPSYPDELRARGEAGSVTIDFYVDEEGRVRLPAITSEDHPIFAREAVIALLQWRFEPPTSMGKPVIAHAKQTFNFARPAKR